MKRKEIVIQRDITDCGPCCLLSIIKHYNGNVPLEKIRLDTYADHRGTSAYNLIEAAKGYGFDAAGINCNSISDIKSFPCIAHVILENGLNHYVVINELKKEKIIIMDPAKGKVIFYLRDFLKIWDNIIITFHPKHEIIKYPEQKNIVSFFLKLILKEKKTYIKIIILSIFITLLNLLINFYFKIGNLALNNNISSVFIFITFLSLIIIKNSFFLFYNNSYINLNSRISKSLISDFTSHIFSLPSKIIQNKTSGEIITRVHELNDVDDLLSKMVIGFILDGLLVVNSGIILLYINIKMSIIIICSLLLQFLISVVLAKKLNVRLHRWINKDTSYNETLLDQVEMYSSINNLQIKKQANDNLNYHLSEKIHEDKRLKKFISIVDFIKSLIVDSSILLLNSIALYLIYKGDLSMLNYIIYNTIYIYLYSSFSNMVNILPEYYYLKNTIYKISEFKNLKIETDLGVKDFSFGNISLNHLSYSYNDQDIIKDVNFTFKKGESYFIKGPSGCGKSTLLKLLYKDMDDYKGTILLDNINYHDIKLNDLKRNITFVNQNEKLFSGTIYQNIVCYRDISQDDFDNICKVCLIDKIIDKKPLRYLSNVKDALVNLSGGEKQQIILARNLLKNGRIIIIDEALSEVDIDTETKIIKNLKNFYKDNTIIYVSHKDLSHLFNCNYVIS